MMFLFYHMPVLIKPIEFSRLQHVVEDECCYDYSENISSM